MSARIANSAMTSLATVGVGKKRRGAGCRCLVKYRCFPKSANVATTACRSSWRRRRAHRPKPSASALNRYYDSFRSRSLNGCWSHPHPPVFIPVGASGHYRPIQSFVGRDPATAGPCHPSGWSHAARPAVAPTIADSRSGDSAQRLIPPAFPFDTRSAVGYISINESEP